MVHRMLNLRRDIDIEDKAITNEKLWYVNGSYYRQRVYWTAPMAYTVDGLHVCYLTLKRYISESYTNYTITKLDNSDCYIGNVIHTTEGADFTHCVASDKGYIYYDEV